jgi:hypothetical protein
MNAFENIILKILEEEDYWVRHSVKVDISKKDKKKIGKPSMPRPEIDIVALHFKKNELLLLEVKSFLDSGTVLFSEICGKGKKPQRYRLLNDEKYRKIVSEKLQQEYLRMGLINKATKINFGLAAGNINSQNKIKIENYFKQKGWKLFSPDYIKDKIKKLSEKSWEDDTITMTAKLALR